ncbi:MAG: hypothetical protein ACQEQ4_07645 [Fibrobacterota bacterium]|jgi:hypothetical protein
MQARHLINVPVLILSIILMIIGYVLLGTGEVDGVYSLTLAPLVLVVVYAVLLPLTVLLNSSKKK